MNFRDLLLRTRTLVAPHRVERELDEELAFHIERETQKHMGGLALVLTVSGLLASVSPPAAACRRRWRSS